MSEKKCYILVDGHTQGMQIFEILKERGQDVRIAPAPREAKSSCGIAVLSACNQLEQALDILNNENISYKNTLEIEQSFDPHRDIFC